MTNESARVRMSSPRSKGLLLRPVPAFRETSLEEVIGCVGYAGPRRTLPDMQNAVPPGYADES